MSAVLAILGVPALFGLVAWVWSLVDEYHAIKRRAARRRAWLERRGGAR